MKRYRLPAAEALALWSAKPAEKDLRLTGQLKIGRPRGAPPQPTEPKPKASPFDALLKESK